MVNPIRAAALTLVALPLAMLYRFRRLALFGVAVYLPLHGAGWVWRSLHLDDQPPPTQTAIKVAGGVVLFVWAAFVYVNADHVPAEDRVEVPPWER